MSFLKKVSSFLGNPLGGAVSGLVGGIGQGLGDYKSAQKQMKFQREMSNTAIRRQMADMRAAGINPILAAKYGGASTPSGASYSIPNIGSAAVEGYKGVSSAKQMQQQTKQSEAQTKNIQEQTKAVEQKLRFDDELHQERWDKIAATMGPDNVIANAIAIVNGIKPGDLARGKTLLSQERIGIMVEAFQSYKSLVGREYAGVRDTGGKVVDRAVEGLKAIGKASIDETADFLNWLVKQDKIVRDLVKEWVK